jgi:hypothetical protein
MRRSAISFTVLLALALACSREEASKPSSEVPPKPTPTEPAQPELDRPPPETETPDSPSPKHGFFMAEGAPDPRECKVADDCTGNTIPDLQNPCCQDPRTLEPYARAYWKWINEWRRDHCEAVTCPPPAPPAMPRRCALEPDCVEGVCVDTCP